MVLGYIRNSIGQINNKHLEVISSSPVKKKATGLKLLKLK